MKNVWQYILMGIMVAIGGMLASEISGKIFNGMDYGSASVLGFCMYLCVVIVTCTGIIAAKLDEKADVRENGEKRKGN